MVEEERKSSIVGFTILQMNLLLHLNPIFSNLHLREFKLLEHILVLELTLHWQALLPKYGWGYKI